MNVCSSKFEGSVGSSTWTVKLTGPTFAIAGVPVRMPVAGSRLSHPAFVPPVSMLHTEAFVPPTLAIVVE